MTREEEIKLYLKERNIPFNSLEANSIIEGAKWADKTMIEKACECIIKLHNWPTQYEEYAKLQEEFIKEFRKAMEE